MVTDPVADFINRIKTAQLAGLPTLTVPFSQMKMHIAEVLLREGYIVGAEKRGKRVKKFIDVTLKYHEGKPEVHGAERLSRPSRRVYLHVGDIRPVKQGHGILVLSTPQGILTGKEAVKARVGGEALFSMW